MDFELSPTSPICSEGPAICSTGTRARPRSGPTSRQVGPRRDPVARPWPSRAGAPLRCPRTRVGSASDGSRRGCCWPRSGATPRPVPLLPSLVATAALPATVAAPIWSSDSRPARPSAPSPGRDRRRSGRCGTPAWRRRGRLGPVEGASIADVLVVVVPDGVHLVDEWERPAAGTGDGPHPHVVVGRRRPAAPAQSTRIGDAGDAAFLGALGAVGSSAELLGGAERALEMATEYAKDRVQFGQPIGSFQAVKHRCADMLVDVEGMRSVVWYGSWSVATADRRAGRSAASTAKVWCADASKRVMASALQVHGGIGFTWEHDLHLFIKRAQFSQLDYGDAVFHRAALGACPAGAGAERRRAVMSSPVNQRSRPRSSARLRCRPRTRPSCCAATPPTRRSRDAAGAPLTVTAPGRTPSTSPSAAGTPTCSSRHRGRRSAVPRGGAARQHARVPLRARWRRAVRRHDRRASTTRGAASSCCTTSRHTDCALLIHDAPPRGGAGAIGRSARSRPRSRDRRGRSTPRSAEVDATDPHAEPDIDSTWA